MVVAYGSFPIAAAVALSVSGLLIFVSWFFVRFVQGRKQHAFQMARWYANFLISLLFVLVAAFVVPKFELVFEAFGPSLPLQTMWLIRFKWLLLLPMTAKILVRGKVDLEWREDPKFYLSFFGQTTLLALVIWSLYSPVLFLGSVAD